MSSSLRTIYNYDGGQLYTYAHILHIHNKNIFYTYNNDGDGDAVINEHIDIDI